MRRARWTRAALLMLTGFLALSPLASEPHRDGSSTAQLRRIPTSLGTEDDPNAQAEMEFLMLRDPNTNAIPFDIRRREATFATGIPDRSVHLRSHVEGATGTAALAWTERGPNNVGGRTRAFAIDVANATTLLAGAVAGGIWKSSDDGGSWSIRTAPAQIHGTTCIAQDQRTGKTNLWYVGTGEIRGSTTNDTRWGSLYRGDGIFKSTDNGDTWTLLPSTSSGTPQTTSDFDFVVNVATNPANLAQDEVFAANHNGIYRSTDGGGTWTKPIASDSGYTDVAVTSAGVIYACTRVGLASPRIWRSPDGINWTNIIPGTFSTIATRIVIGLAPSNPNVVYFFASGASPGPNGHQLWKYTYVSGDGSGAGGTWENRTPNLPSGAIAINTQGAYDQIIHVKPNDEHFVLIGGTDLYRSTNGFTSTAATTVIGGYPFFPGPHHPDLQAGAFSNANPNVYYSAHDGGISKAADITIPLMEWTTLNHGYNVTQFYSVSIAPESGSNMIMAGAQDNGTQLGNAPGASDWIMAYGGDGMVCEVAPAADDRLYTQYQGGQMQRQNRDGSNLLNITPSGATNQLFVNPIVLDPNNSALLYYAAGISSSTSRIFRNDSAPIATASTGWTSLAATEVGAGSGYTRRITTLGISTASNPNVLYYGTVDGLVMRADNANTAAPTVTNITPPGLNGGMAWGGFVRCIAVDPTNSNKALLAFGNYNFPSLWYTTNGGASWTDVEGNLAGASGPSVRWASMFYIDGNLQVFLGTSIGVLSTSALAGGSTVWAQEGGSTVGNILIGYMDYRASDRTLAIGTHARGVFTTTFPPPVGVDDGSTGHREQVALSQSYPNPTNRSATIAYELPRAADVSLKVYDVSGRGVATLVNERQDRGRHEAHFTSGRLRGGVYYYVLRMGGATETRKLLLRR